MTHSTLQMGLALAGALAGLGLTFMLTGAGVVWATKAKKEEGEVELPDTVPESFLEDHKAEVTAG